MNLDGQIRCAAARGALAVAVAALALAPIHPRADSPTPAGAPEVLLDRDGTLTAEALLAPPWSERFEPLDGPRSFGSAAPPMWLRFPLENPGVAPLAVLVTWDFPLVERLALYLVEAGGPRLVARGGLSVPPEARQFEFRGEHHEVLVTLPPGARAQALLRVETRATAFAGLSARPAGSAGGAAPFVLLRYGVGIGLVLILAALALAQSAAFRDPAYLYYALFVLAYGAYAAAVTGLGPLLLWPGSAAFALVAQPLFAFSRITGWAPEEVLGRSIRRDRHLGRRRRAGPPPRDPGAATGRRHNLEFTFRVKDGRTGPGLLSARAIEIEGEAHVLTITREITATPGGRGRALPAWRTSCARPRSSRRSAGSPAAWPTASTTCSA